eukprot:359265-Chlamydomonas_euryale.AAC.2
MKTRECMNLPLPFHTRTCVVPHVYTACGPKGMREKKGTRSCVRAAEKVPSFCIHPRARMPPPRRSASRTHRQRTWIAQRARCRPAAVLLTAPAASTAALCVLRAAEIGISALRTLY